MKIISVSDISAEVEWKEIKNVHLTIYPPNARIHVSAPLSMTEEAVRLFLITKLPWIKQRVSQILDQNRQTPREYVSGENHYFKGHRYRLKVIQYNGPAKVELMGNEFIVLYVRNGATEERKAEILREWYRAEFKTLLPPMIAKWEEILVSTSSLMRNTPGAISSCVPTIIMAKAPAACALLSPNSIRRSAFFMCSTS